MVQLPPKGPSQDGRPGDRRTGKNALTPVPDKHTRMFSTGNHAAVEGPARTVIARRERGARIFGDIKRAVLFAFVLVVVGVVLAQFVKAL
jgi:hypothetical protein